MKKDIKKYKHVPKHIKELRGTTRADRDGKGLVPPKALEYIPDPPVEYSDQQKAMYFDIVHFLMNANALYSVGLHWVHVYCTQYKIYQECYDILNGKSKRGEPGGIVVVSETKHGTIYTRNQAMVSMKDALSTMMQISDRFGFTPLSMSKIHVNAKTEDKKDSQFDIE